MNYKAMFHAFQESYTSKYPSSLQMRSYLPELNNKSILDVGCGSGIDLVFFKEKKAEKISAIDASNDLVAIAKQQMPEADIESGSFDALPWQDESFDIVWSKYALNCAKDISVPIKEIHRVCKTGGTVLLQVTHPLRTLKLLSTKNYFSDGSLIEYPLVNGTILQEYHYTMSAWINAVCSVGLSVVGYEEIINKPISEYEGEITPSALILILKK